MTKKLEELWDLESKEQLESEGKKSPPAPTHEQVQSLDDSFAAVQEITKDLPEVAELDSIDDTELDHLANKSEQAYDDLMDLGMNVEVRYSGRIFEVASSMMKNAIDAKTAKIDKKLKAVDAKLKKYKIDKDNATEGDGDIISGEGYVVTDRNELLKKLGGKE
jgi:hypothetical protein